MSRSEGFDEFYQATYSRLVGQLYPVTGWHRREPVGR
jgi:hypothetical protein